MNRTNLWIIIQIKEELKKLEKSKEYFSSPKDFTRDRVFTFETVFNLIADLPRRSLSVEIEKGLELISVIIGEERSGTKSGFCKARNKILPKLFREINEKLLTLFYELNQSGKVKKWKGFLLKGVDGMIVDIVDTEENRIEFGVQKNQHGGVVQGRMMLSFDVENRLITHAHLGNLSIGESSVVKKWLKNIKSNDLNIYDRLFPGMSFQYLHDVNKIPYVMRCKLGHNERVKEFVNSKKKEKTEDWVLNANAVKELQSMGYDINDQTTIRVRLVRIKLDNGEIEVLITSLLDNKKYPHKIFKALYFKRWGVEVENGFLKNTLQIEITSGNKPRTIYQDFYATIFRANIQVLIELDCEPRIRAINKTRKHNYAVNKNVAAGNLKGKFIQLFLGNNPNEVYEKIVVLFLKNIEPIRSGRILPRLKRSQKLNGKFKRFRNYKRAV